MKASEDLVITIKHIVNQEVVNLKLSANVRCRFTEMESKLKPFNLYFGDECTLYEGDRPVAYLASCCEELSWWLEGEDF